jgi:hypothetical protein
MIVSVTVNRVPGGGMGNEKENHRMADKEDASRLSSPP